MKALLILAAQALAFWPVLHWAWLRTRYESEAGAEAVAALAAVALVVREARAGGTARPALPGGLLVPSALLVAYALLFPALSELARGVLAATTLVLSAGQLLVPRRSLLPLLGLALLALPVVPVLQYQLGPPLQVVTAALAAPLLRLLGLDVVAAGACLQGAEQLVWVDAPCSGLRMLWSGSFLVLASSGLLRLGSLGTLLAVASGAVVLVAGNAWRAATLFLLETGVVDPALASHDAVGLLVHALTAGALAVLLLRWGGARCAPSCT